MFEKCRNNHLSLSAKKSRFCKYACKLRLLYRNFEIKKEDYADSWKDWYKLL